MRSWRRGTKEMDLILGAFADARLGGLDEATLALYDALLSENDHDLYQWVSGAAPAPERFAGLIGEITAAARAASAGSAAP
jgi:antitoxin CptB